MVTTLAACVTTARDLPVADLDQLEREGKLAALFDEMVADKPMLVKLPVIGAGKKEQLASLGDRLAKSELARLTAALEAKRLATQALPLMTLVASRPDGDKIKRWSEVRHREWIAFLDREDALSRQVIAQENAKLSALPADDAIGRMRVLAGIAAQGGAGSKEESFYGQSLSDTKSRLYESGLQLLRDKAPDAAEKAFGDLLTLDVKFKDASVQLSRARLHIVEREFREPRGDEAIENAYKRYLALNGDANFKALGKEVEPVALDVRTYYQTLAAAALAEERLADADRYLLRARSVVGLASDVPPMAEELTLVEKVRTHFDHAQRAARHGLALAYLNVIETYQPEYPQLKKLIRETREKAQEQAQKRVGISAFGGTDATARLGSAVSAKVAQLLYQQLPNDIRLVERDQLQAVLREQEILAIQNKSSVNIVSTDLLVQGTLVEASVESDEKKGRQVKRVKTGENAVANPAWSAWKQLSNSDREKTPAPPEKVFEPVMEDVAINVGVHRKKGILSIAFKLIDSASAKVLLTRTETLRKTAESESSDAVQLGSYVVPMKVAELPSDNEMFGGLVEDAAQLIAHELAGFLKDQERQCEKMAQRHSSEDNHADAAELYSYATLIGQLKKIDTRVYMEAMRREALEARFAG